MVSFWAGETMHILAEMADAGEQAGRRLAGEQHGAAIGFAGG